MSTANNLPHMSDKLIQVLEKFKLPLSLALLGIVLIVGGLIMGSKTPKNFPKESIVENPVNKLLTVDVSGAVNKPGVYKLKDGSRIEDAVSASGGFSGEVNQEYIAKVLNLAQKLVDGSKVYIPKAGEATGIVAGVSANQAAGGKININLASPSELESLQDIAKTRAQSIISGRPYQTIEELVSKKIISKTIFDKIKDQLVVY